MPPPLGPLPARLRLRNALWPPPLPRPQNALFSRRFAGFAAGRLQGPMPPTMGACSGMPQATPPLLKKVPVSVSTNPCPYPCCMAVTATTAIQPSTLSGHIMPATAACSPQQLTSLKASLSLAVPPSLLLLLKAALLPGRLPVTLPTPATAPASPNALRAAAAALRLLLGSFTVMFLLKVAVDPCCGLLLGERHWSGFVPAAPAAVGSIAKLSDRKLQVQGQHQQPDTTQSFSGMDRSLAKKLLSAKRSCC